MIANTSSPTSKALDSSGHWLPFARAAWLALALVYLAIWFASVPGYYARVSTLTIQPFRLGERVIFDNTTALSEATQRGVSLPTSAAVDIAFNLLQILVYYLVAALILWRASTGFGWFTALVLMLMGVFAMTRAVSVAVPFAAVLFLLEIPAYIVWPLWLLWLYLFPNGHPVPRWTWSPVLVLFVLFMLLQILSLLGVFGILPTQIDLLAATAAPVALIPVFGFVLFSQIYRYRRSSTIIERQQTKWFLFGIGILFLTLVLFAISPGVFKTSILAQNLFATLFLTFPVSVALAVLRYRLWEIDIIIHRTLVYLPLTAVIAGIFAMSITLSQRLFFAVTGANSDFATGFATLITVAAFEPIKSRIQAFVDKRFKEAPDPTRALDKVRDQAREILQVLEPRASARHVLDAAVRAFDATGGAVLEQNGTDAKTIYQVGEWNGAVQLKVPLSADGVGPFTIALGARRNGAVYTDQDRELLERTIEPISQALQLLK